MAVASDVSSSSSWLKFFQRQRDAHEEDEQLFSKARRLLSSPFSRVAGINSLLALFAGI